MGLNAELNSPRGFLPVKVIRGYLPVEVRSIVKVNDDLERKVKTWERVV